MFSIHIKEKKFKSSHIESTLNEGIYFDLIEPLETGIGLIEGNICDLDLPLELDKFEKARFLIPEETIEYEYNYKNNASPTNRDEIIINEDLLQSKHHDPEVQDQHPLGEDAMEEISNLHDLTIEEIRELQNSIKIYF